MNIVRGDFEGKKCWEPNILDRPLKSLIYLMNVG